MDDLRGQRALITGGAGGIGTALARELAAAGAEIVLADLDRDALERARAELAENGVASQAVVFDVTSPDSVEAGREALHRDVGPIQILVNNAGVVHGGPFLDVPLERHLATYRVNVEGVVTTTHTFLPDLLVARSAHLVNLASASGFIGLPYGSTYASSKWAVIGFSESIRLELEKQGHSHVGVTTVCPSYVDTGMFEGVRPPLLTRFLTPEELAVKVVEAILGGKHLVLEPWLVKMTPLLAHALPGRLGDRVADLFGASTSMQGWTGREGAPPGDD